VGTAQGYSALWLGMAVRVTGGKVITIEIDPALARQARENIRCSGLQDVIESKTNDALLEIPAISGEFDFVFLDLGGAHHKQLLDILYPRLAEGGAIVSHNAYALRFTGDGYMTALDHNANLSTMIVPTISGGIAVSVKKSSLP
jgi:predicted O-methyltransferase YrrM